MTDESKGTEQDEDEVIPYEHLRRLEGGAAGRPANKRSLGRARRQLEELGRAMPPELAGFLSRMDGFFFNGIEIFPISEASIPDADFHVPTLVQKNRANVNADRVPPGWLQVGASDEDQYFYLPARKLWVIVDRTGLDVYEDFDSFTGLFTFVLFERGGMP